MNFSYRFPIEDVNSLLNSGEKKAVDFIQQLCEMIDFAEPHIHSLIPEKGRKERLLSEIKKLPKSFPCKKERTFFYGMPVGVKDIFRVDGFATQCGSKLPAELFEGEEASCVTKLKENGALILGKTVTTEFAYFEPGPTKNPLNINHTPGGSSSGSAAAVAAGLTPLALGTQTIGSIIRPAAFCGVFGFKPSYERIDAGGVIPFSPSADHIGFMTQNIFTCCMAAIVLLKNFNPKKYFDIPKRPFVIGVPTGKYIEQASRKILDEFKLLLQFLKGMDSFIIKETELFKDTEKINASHYSMVAAEMAEVHNEWFAKYEPLYRNHTKQIILEGQKVGKTKLDEAKNGRFALRNYIEDEKLKNGIDLWLSPATVTTAPTGLESTGSPLMNLPWTYAGLPAINIPVKKKGEELPYGLQFCGSFNEDEMFLGILEEISAEIN